MAMLVALDRRWCLVRCAFGKEAQASGYLLLHKPVANEVLHAAIARLMQMQPPAVAGAPGA